MSPLCVVCDSSRSLHCRRSRRDVYIILYSNILTAAALPWHVVLNLSNIVCESLIYGPTRVVSESVECNKRKEKSIIARMIYNFYSTVLGLEFAVWYLGQVGGGRE